MSPRPTDFPKARKLANALLEELIRIPSNHGEEPEWFIMDILESLACRRDEASNTQGFDYLQFAIDDYRRSYPRLFERPPIRPLNPRVMR